MASFSPDLPSFFPTPSHRLAHGSLLLPITCNTSYVTWSQQQAELLSRTGICSELPSALDIFEVWAVGPVSSSCSWFWQNLSELSYFRDFNPSVQPAWYWPKHWRKQSVGELRSFFLKPYVYLTYPEQLCYPGNNLTGDKHELLWIFCNCTLLGSIHTKIKHTLSVTDTFIFHLNVKTSRLILPWKRTEGNNKSLHSLIAKTALQLFQFHPPVITQLVIGARFPFITRTFHNNNKQ